MEIQLTQGQVTVIDDKHADLATLRWYAAKSGAIFYARRGIRRLDGKRATEDLHQVIARRMGIVGAPDHIDRNGLNNLESNLRPDPDRLSQANRGLFSSNKSGYRGVCWYKTTSKWLACIKVNGKQRHLGYFVDPIEAAKAYDRAALEAFGEFAVPNFPGRSL